MDAIDEEQTRIGCHGLRIPGWRDRVQVKLRDVYACNLGRRGLKLVSKSNINTLNSSPVSCLPLKIYILFFSSPLEHSTLSIVTIFSFFLYEKKKKDFQNKLFDISTEVKFILRFPIRLQIVSLSSRFLKLKIVKKFRQINLRR